MWSAGKVINGSEEGFTYSLVLVAIVVLAISVNGASFVVSRQVKAAKEAELLFRGRAYLRAISSYYHAREGAPELPRRLEDLTNDPRFPHRRHIRRLYGHPLDDRDWVVIHGSDGGIQGVASPNRERPLKQANFPPGLSSFEGAERYRDWVFLFRPSAKDNQPVSPVLPVFPSYQTKTRPLLPQIWGGYSSPSPR